MIILYSPRATKPRNRRFPLSILALAAVLEGREDYSIVDGNLDGNPTETLLALMREKSVELLAVTVMPGPQMACAVETCRRIRAAFPHIPIVWGGYFPTIYTAAVLNANYVDFAVRGQGEETLLELVEALRKKRSFESVRGLSFKDGSGRHYHNPERPMKGPDAFSWYPYHRLPVEDYLRPSFFGRRTAVHQASIGCPYQCSFCGVVTAYGAQQKMESPARTESILRHLARNFGADSIQFYDNNFFLREDHARELMDRIAPLGLRWWCEARIDLMLRFSDATFEAIRRAGCTMIFFGAESGSDWVLKEMNKHLKAEQTLELARRIRQFEQMYGEVEGQFEFPKTLEEWMTRPWQDFSTRKDPLTPWLKPSTKRRIDNFRLVLSSRWPTVQDPRLPRWGRRTLQTISAWRYRVGFYNFPYELQLMQWLVHLRKPEAESL